MKKGQVIRLDVDSCCDSSYVNSNVDELDDLFELKPNPDFPENTYNVEYERANDGTVKEVVFDSFWVVLLVPLTNPPIKIMPSGDSQDMLSVRGTDRKWLVFHWPSEKVEHSFTFVKVS